MLLLLFFKEHCMTRKTLDNRKEKDKGCSDTQCTTFVHFGSTQQKLLFHKSPTSYNPGKKELGHLTHFIAIIPVLAIVRTFGAMYCFKEAT